MKELYAPLFFLSALILFNSPAHSQTITFSELNYNSDSTINSGNWVELFNYGTVQLDIGNWVVKDDDDLHIFTIPSGTILQPGGRLVITDDIVKFQTQHPFVTPIGNIPYSFGNDGDQVRLFDNYGLLKVFMQYADSTPWPPAPDGTGRTLELLDPLESPDSASNWFVGCIGGSPGTAFVPCNDPIVFGEINYNSDSLKDSGDWVEIWNHSPGSINLTGWSFKDSNDDNIYFFPANTQLPADGRLVLIHDTALFFSRHPAVTNWVGPFDFNVSSNGELIRLFDHLGKLKFSVVYNNKGNWPDSADGKGYTLELLDPNGNVNSPDNWFAGCPEGSPGYAYTPNCNVGIEDVSTQQLQLYNNLTDHSILIEAPGNGSYSGGKISIYNLYGEEVLYSLLHDNITWIDVSYMAAGLYIVKLSSGKNFLTRKFIVP